MAIRLVAMMVVASVWATACGNSSPSLLPVPPRPSPVLLCGDLAAGDCEAALSAASSVALASNNGVVVRIELGRGVWCPTPGLLFAGTSCPAGGLPPPGGGHWIGHALVTFADSATQAYINIAKNGQAIRGELIALATPPPQ